MAESYDVCLSFAGEQRPYVDDVARLLRDNGVKVFYDDYEVATLWGKDLATYLDDIYRKRSRYCVLFASADYVRKTWTHHERASALDRLLRERDDYVLPVRLDDTEIPGLRESIGHLDGRRLSPGEVVQQLLLKLGMDERKPVRPVTVLVLAADGDVDLHRVLDVAQADANVEVEARRLDGARLLGMVEDPPSHVLDRLVPAVERAFGERTGATLLIGVHKGAVAEDDWNSVDVRSTVDLTEAPAVHEVLTLATNADCAIVLSQRLYDEVARNKATYGSYVGVPLASGTGWVRVRGYLKPPRPKSSPEPTSQKTTTNNFYAPTRIKHLGDRHG
ncbi:TIR domain-containing protein [Lentzea alba]|uniref:toll/interleukin-1 receptor domain-containing protein n=1 Tax=Lentzea alba TaxID=2714351 RepID=UPI0039BEF37D